MMVWTHLFKNKTLNIAQTVLEEIMIFFSPVKSQS